eukprot:TRINITY_DN258_c1_g1_i1.p1 TRINITY_DN258_c1_g1~~TRINITY_DN258_c1_g1_i1.p1  ORF type:complete len:658 (+),score=161.50 TRINITY_DN258_c1_g1_i1:78-1976(+)
MGGSPEEPKKDAAPDAPAEASGSSPSALELELGITLPPPKPSPANADAWKTATKSTLSEVGSLTRDLLKQLDDHSAVESKHPFPLSPLTLRSQNRSMQVRCGLGEKCRTTINIGPRVYKTRDHNMGMCSEQMSSFDNRTVHLKDCLIATEHSQKAKWAALKVCEWRLELRARRPPQELFRDNVQEALEKEKDILVKSRQELQGLAKELKNAVVDVGACRLLLFRHHDKLSRDGVLSEKPPMVTLPPAKPAPAPAAEGGAEDPGPALPEWIGVGQKLEYVNKASNGMTMDVQVEKVEEKKKTVLVTFEKDKKVTKRVPFSEIDASGDGTLRLPRTSDQMVGSATLATQQQLLQKAGALDQSVAALAKRAEAKLNEINTKCTDASTSTMANFNKRAIYTSELKRKVEEQLALTENAITAAEKKISRCKNADKAASEEATVPRSKTPKTPKTPMDKTLLPADAGEAAPTSPAAAPAAAEVPASPASPASPAAPAAAEGEAVAATSSEPSSEVRKSLEATEAKLAKLREAKALLEEDLRCKLASVKIDDQCRRVPPHMTPAHPQRVAPDFNKLVLSMSCPDLAALMRPSRSMPSSPASPTSPSMSRTLKLPPSPSKSGSPAGSSSALRAAALSATK